MSQTVMTLYIFLMTLYIFLQTLRKQHLSMGNETISLASWANFAHFPTFEQSGSNKISEQHGQPNHIIIKALFVDKRYINAIFNFNFNLISILFC